MDNINHGFASRMAIVLEIFNGNISELARQAGIKPPSAKRWITGESDPQMSNLVKLAKAAGVSVEWLATGEGQMRPNMPAARPAINANPTEIATDTIGNPVDLEDFVFIPQYETLAAPAENPPSAEPEDETKYPVAFRRAWLKRNVPVELDQLSVISVKGDSMEGVLNDRDTILINHTQQSPADGVYVIRIGNDLLVKRTQVLPHNRLKVLSENQSYEPFEVDLNERNLDFKVVGRVEACFHRL